MHSSALKVDAPIINGLLGIYGKGGYVKNLGQSQEESAQILAELNANNWIDRGTRAVFVDFTTYNANINLFCQIRYIFNQFWILKNHNMIFFFEVNN